MSLPRLSGTRLATTVKFSVFALVCLAILAFLAQRVGNLSFFSHRVTYQAQMGDVTGLNPSDDVKIAGITVGTVSSIAIQHGHALVSFTVDHQDRLRASTQDGLRWRNVLGQKYLYLYPGTAGPYLGAGATLPLAQSISGGEVDDFLNALGPFLKAIDPREANAFVAAVVGGLQGNQTRVADLIGNTAVVSRTLGDLNAQVGSLVGNLDAVLSALASRSGDLDAVITRLSSAASTLAAGNDTLDAAVVDFARLAGQLRQLVTTNRANLDTAINNLESITTVLSRHHGDLQASLDTFATGFAPYFQISSYGQWFQVRAVYLCLANEAACAYQNPVAALGGSGTSGPLGSILGGAPGGLLGGLAAGAPARAGAGSSPGAGAGTAAPPDSAGPRPASANPALDTVLGFAASGGSGAASPGKGAGP